MNRTAIRTATAIACTASLALGFSGCGSSKDSGPKTLTSTQFKSKANKICKDGNADIKTYGAGITDSSTPTEIVTALDKSADRVDQEVASIKKLKAPKSKADDVSAFLDAVTTATKTIKAQGVALLQSGAADPFTDSDAKAKALDLTDCVQSGS
jgi:hypothetical protein